MSSQPPEQLIDAILEGDVTVTRRVEFYESDQFTRWDPEDSDTEPLQRLIEGNVTLDYNRAERRTVEMTLDNEDNTLRPEPINGFWYDKVVRPYRGYRYAASTKPPRIVIVEEDTANQARALRNILSGLNFYRTDILTSATSYADIAQYDMVISYTRGTATSKYSLLQTAFENGKDVVTFGINNATSLPNFIASTTTGDFVPGVAQTSWDNPLKTGWTDQAQGSNIVGGTRISGVMPDVLITSNHIAAGTTGPSSGILTSSAGGRWFMFHSNSIASQGQILLKNALNWLWNYTPYKHWEFQMGEFLIDKLEEEDRPHHLKVSGRDFTKKCLTIKFPQSTGYAAGAKVVDVVRAIATAAGITKFRLPGDTIEKLNARLAIERGTERWTVMNDLASSNGYELFFDNQGYLTMRKFIDPVTAGLVRTYSTGPYGNLISWNRSSNDSRLYNHIVILGTTEDDTVLPFFGEAKNVEPSSPTRISRIGQRTYQYASSFFTSNKQCQDLANAWLKIKALESYELNWSTLVFPWSEVGEVVGFADPRALPHEPDRFLLDTLAIPLGLGTMESTGKRITYVNDPTSNIPDVEETEDQTV